MLTIFNFINKPWVNIVTILLHIMHPPDLFFHQPFEIHIHCNSQCLHLHTISAGWVSVQCDEAGVVLTILASLRTGGRLAKPRHTTSPDTVTTTRSAEAVHQPAARPSIAAFVN